jgi:hypothetical protein
MKTRGLAFFGMLVIVAATLAGSAQVATAQEEETPQRLVVLWRSGDPEIFNSALYLYTLNSKRFKWFDEVTLVVWGPSQKLLLEDEEIQAKVAKMQRSGVRVLASIDCAIDYGIEARLRDELGLRVMIMGPYLTRYLQEDYDVLSF